jgi:hypothetical protein
MRSEFSRQAHGLFYSTADGLSSGRGHASRDPEWDSVLESIHTRHKRATRVTGDLEKRCAL